MELTEKDRQVIDKAMHARFAPRWLPFVVWPFILVGLTLALLDDIASGDVKAIGFGLVVIVAVSYGQMFQSFRERTFTVIRKLAGSLDSASAE